jgi:hypothetical protein
MNVIGHDNVAHDHEAIALADFLEYRQKQIAPLWARQPGLAMITTAGDEMQLIRAVVAPRMVGHTASLVVPAKKSCDGRPHRSHLYKKRKGGPATGCWPRICGSMHDGACACLLALCIQHSALSTQHSVKALSTPGSFNCALKYTRGAEF